MSVALTKPAVLLISSPSGIGIGSGHMSHLRVSCSWQCCSWCSAIMMSAFRGHISDSPTLSLLYMWALSLLCPVPSLNRMICSDLFSLWRLSDWFTFGYCCFHFFLVTALMIVWESGGSGVLDGQGGLWRDDSGVQWSVIVIGILHLGGLWSCALGVYSGTASGVAILSDVGMTVPAAEDTDEVWHWPVCMGCSLSSHSFISVAERACLWSWRDLSAQSVSRLTVWGLLLPSCSGQCSRLLGPSCTHP